MQRICLGIMKIHIVFIFVTARYKRVFVYYQCLKPKMD